MKGSPPPESPPRFELRVLPDAAVAAEAAARELVEASKDALGNRATFCVALSGGSTPKRMFQALAGEELRGLVDWKRARVFFADERCVPPNDERSNYRLAKEHLLDPLAVPPENVFRMRGEEEPERAARDYEAVLRRELGAGRAAPRFDLVFLGLGTDGHTASLFPGSRAVEEKRRWVAAIGAPELPERRLTLTLPVLNASRRVVFLVTGEEKRAAVAAVLAAKRGSSSLPASLVKPKRGSLIWILDKAAASGL